MLRILLPFLVAVGLQNPAAAAVVDAGPALSGVVAPDAPGSAMVPAAAPATAPEVKIADPVQQPAQAFDDLKGAKRYGWAGVVFVLLVLITRTGMVYSERVPFLKFLGKGQAHSIIAAVSAFAMTAYNALVLGGTLYAAMGVGLGTFLYNLVSTPQIKPPKEPTV